MSGFLERGITGSGKEKAAMETLLLRNVDRKSWVSRLRGFDHKFSAKGGESTAMYGYVWLMAKTAIAVILFCVLNLTQGRAQEGILKLAAKVSLNDCLAEKAFLHPQGEKLVARNHHIAGVISPNPSGQHSMLIGIDKSSSENGCWAFPLGEDEFFDVAINDTTIVVLTAAVTGRGGARIRVLDFTGKLLEEINDQPDIFRVLLINNRLVGITRPGAVRDIRAGNERMLTTGKSLVESRLYLGQSNGVINLVDRETGSIVSLADGTTKRMLLQHSALISAKASHATSPGLSRTQNLIISASADQEDNNYFLIGGFMATEGAPVLIMPQGGNKITRAIRVPVTMGDDSMFQIPVSVAVDGERLFILDSNGTVTEFNLP